MVGTVQLTLVGRVPTLLPIAHRDGGGQLTLAVLACRKITIAAVNGHAVRRTATPHLRSINIHPYF